MAITLGNTQLYPLSERKNQEKQQHMLWSLLIFHGHSTRDPVLVVCNDEQADLFYSAGPHRKNSGAILENAGEWTERVEVSEETIPGSGLACTATYGPAPGFKGKTFELRVLNRCFFNFCLGNTPLRGRNEGKRD